MKSTWVWASHSAGCRGVTCIFIQQEKMALATEEMEIHEHQLGYRCWWCWWFHVFWRVKAPSTIVDHPYSNHTKTPKTFKSWIFLVPIRPYHCLWLGLVWCATYLPSSTTRSPSVPVPIQEPLSTDSPLWDMENLLLSPHNADLTPMHLGVEFASLGNVAANPPLRKSNNLELLPIFKGKVEMDPTFFFKTSCFTPGDHRYMHQTWEIFLQKLSDFTSPSFGGFKDQVDKSCGY